MTFLLLLGMALSALQMMRADAFTFQPAAGPSSRPQTLTLTPSVPTTTSYSSTTVSALFMSEEASADGGAEISSEDSEETASEKEEAASPKEDPEVTALKEEIAKLEAAFAEEKSKLEAALDQCEEYSKTGYARKVADMENMKRVRSSIASTSQSSAIASVLRDFMPAYDTLNNLQQKYADDEFGSKYSELHLQQTFANLGVTDFGVAPGEEVNNFRMKVLEKEVSKDFVKDTVIRQVSPGLELDGNVIRAASCVASLGTGEDEESAEGGEETPAE